MPLLKLDRLDAVRCRPGFWSERPGLEPGGRVWPGPRFLFAALHAALHARFPQIQLWEHNHASGAGGRYPERHVRWQRFGSLSSIGPFPQVETGENAKWLFAQPNDVATDPSGLWTGAALSRPRSGERWSLPQPLRYVTIAGASEFCSAASWWSKSAIEAYLQAQPIDCAQCFAPGTLYDVHPIIPMGQPVSLAGSVNRDGARAVQLWLKDHLALGGWASMPLKAAHYQQGLDYLMAQAETQIALGTWRNRARIQLSVPDRLEHWLPLSTPVIGTRVKWLLLAPAVFPQLNGTSPAAPGFHPGGWLPNWVCPLTGQVLLKKGAPERGSTAREPWREQVRKHPNVDCRLVACSLAGSAGVGGWSERRHVKAQGGPATPGPREVCRAVPAGTVYYFEGTDAAALAELLAWHGSSRQNVDRVQHRRSTRFGEQGFGIGVCGSWDFSAGENS
jgi:CRISPR-associated protein Cmr3